MDKAGWTGTLSLILLGALGFWLPDVLLHAIRGYNFNSSDVWVITAVVPLTLLVTFVAVKRAKGIESKRAGLLMVAGVWLLGGLFMTLGASFSGGGFMGPEGARGAVMLMLLSVLPMYTFIMATYDGSLAALLLVTAVALLVHLSVFQLCRRHAHSH